MGGNIKSIIPALVLATAPLHLCVAGEYQHPLYISLDRLHSEDPMEAKRSDEFAERVRNPAIVQSNMEPITISVIYPGDQISDYWRRSVIAMIRRLDDSNIPYRLTNNFTRPGLDLVQQANIMAEALKTNPDYLIFTLDAEEHSGFIEQIITRSSTKIILQNITTPLARWKGRQPFMYVGFDHQTGTRLLADKYLQLTGGIARYAILYGTNGYVSNMRGESFRMFMSDHPGMRLIDAFFVGFNREKAREATKELLRKHPDIDFIYCVSTDIAFGAIDALGNAGRQNDIMINGWGGGSHELSALRAGELDFTVMRMNDDNGVAMADAILLDQTGRTNEVPLVYSGEFHLLTKTTSDQLISVLEERAFRYSD